MTYTIHINLWYNYPENAILEAPDLGQSPHAEAAMRHYGIKYKGCWGSPITDSWTFVGCDKIPAIIPRWMSVQEEPAEDVGG